MTLRQDVVAKKQGLVLCMLCYSRQPCRFTHSQTVLKPSVTHVQRHSTMLLHKMYPQCQCIH